MSEKSTVAEDEARLRAELDQLARTKRERQLLEALDAGFLPQGVRMVDWKNPVEGLVLAFTPEEAAALVGPLRQIVNARLEGSAK